MKRSFIMRSCLLWILLHYIAFQVHSEPVTFNRAEKAALSKIKRLGFENELAVKREKAVYGSSGAVIYYVFDLHPAGYIVVSADTDLPPVIAYSFTSSYTGGETSPGVLEEILIADISLRLENVKVLPPVMVEKRHQSWMDIVKDHLDPAYVKDFQQWPPQGSTTTGGWVETLWTQNSPYNVFCPMDPVTSVRSLAGCPAVAMAMILDYHRTIHSTNFSDADDYYHSYAGRQYWIDDDHEYVDFPAFPELNVKLDTLTSRYEKNAPVSPNDKAALIFACGIAAHQVYTSSISGTFGIQYAHQAYQKFQFNEASLLWASDTGFFSRLTANMKAALPAHLSVNNEGGTVGHNVIVDGYNTDNYYHVNFGWGGSYNGWYLLPEEFPYGLTVLKGVVVDIGLYLGITLDLKVFLEGPYNGSGMNTFINSALPLVQPFNSPPWNYSGSESVSSIPGQDIVDWILVELRETTGGPQNATQNTTIAMQAGFILNDGTVVATDGSSPLQFVLTITEELYAVIWHTNHLGILSAYALTENNGNYTYDFTTGQSQVYGGALACKPVGSVWVMAGGDGNADGQTNNLDKNDVWVLQAGNAGYLNGDFNLDMQVNNLDKVDVWAPGSGMGCQVPDFVPKAGLRRASPKKNTNARSPTSSLKRDFVGQAR